MRIFQKSHPVWFRSRAEVAQYSLRPGVRKAAWRVGGRSPPVVTKFEAGFNGVKFPNNVTDSLCRVAGCDLKCQVGGRLPAAR